MGLRIHYIYIHLLSHWMFGQLNTKNCDGRAGTSKYGTDDTPRMTDPSGNDHVCLWVLGSFCSAKSLFLPLAYNKLSRNSKRSCNQYSITNFQNVVFNCRLLIFEMRMFTAGSQLEVTSFRFSNWHISVIVSMKHSYALLNRWLKNTKVTWKFWRTPIWICMFGLFLLDPT